MAQTSTIDPAPRPAPSRSTSRHGKRETTFAAALGEALDQPRAKAEPRDESARTKRTRKSEPVKTSPDQHTPRKADHPRDVQATSKPGSEPAKRETEIGEASVAVQQENESESGSLRLVQAASDYNAIADDELPKSDTQDEPGPNPTVNVTQHDIITNTPHDNAAPPLVPIQESPQSKSDLQSEEHGSDLEIDASMVTAQPKLPPRPKASHELALQSESQSEQENFADSKTAKPAPDPSSETRIVNSEKSALPPPTKEHSESTVSKAHIEKPSQNVDEKFQWPGSTGSAHTLHHHLGLDSSPAQPTSSSPLPEPTRSAPVPYHALPIEIGLRALDGAKEISLDLTPKELGQLSIRISVDDQSSIQISIAAEQPKTLTLLQHDAPQIRHALEQAGYATTDTSLQFSLQNQMSSNSNSSRDDQRKPSPRRGSHADISSVDTNMIAPIPHRIYLNQLDLSV